MAINKKLIHFKNFSDFNSKKLSANENNTQYTLGIEGSVTNGSPDILYQSICYIKDTKQQWTHGQLYDGSKSDTPLNETDPIFSASPAAGITENDKEAWNNKVDAEDINNIKPLIADFSISDISAYIHYGTGFNYHSASIINALQNKQPIYIPYENNGLEGYYPVYGFIEDLIYLDVFFGNTVYKLELDLSRSEIVSIDERNSDNFVAESDLANIALTGDYNDLTNKPTIPAEQVNADWNATSGKAQILNKPTIPSAVTEATVSGWGFTKNTGTYSKPSTGIPVSDLSGDIQTSLGKANTALQSYTEQYKGTITGVSANGTSVATSGVANIPAASTSVYGVTKLSSSTNSTSTTLAATASAVKSAYDLANSKQEKLTSGTNIKTINGESLLGSGDVVIGGGNVQAVDTGDVLDDVTINYATTTYVDNKVANIDLTSYATTTYVDGLVGNINSVLENIING